MAESTNDELTFTQDQLGRQRFADRLVKYTIALAESESLPAGRVLAVDAPWGSGKSWIAQRLPSHMNSSRGIGEAIYVNAFEFDFHHDPFVVLASAVLDATSHRGPVSTELKKAAGGVVRSMLPQAPA